MYLLFPNLLRSGTDKLALRERADLGGANGCGFEAVGAKTIAVGCRFKAVGADKLALNCEARSPQGQIDR